eukprot:845390_1
MADSQMDLSTDSSTGSTDLVDLSDEGKAPEATVISDPQAKRKRTFLEVLSPDSARNHTVEVTLQKAPGPEPRAFEVKVVSDLQLPEVIAFVPKTAREQEEIGDPLSQIRFKKMEISSPDLALSEALTDVLSGLLTDQHFDLISAALEYVNALQLMLVPLLKLVNNKVRSPATSLFDVLALAQTDMVECAEQLVSDMAIDDHHDFAVCQTEVEYAGLRMFNLRANILSLPSAIRSALLAIEANAHRLNDLVQMGKAFTDVKIHFPHWWSDVQPSGWTPKDDAPGSFSIGLSSFSSRTRPTRGARGGRGRDRGSRTGRRTSGRGGRRF